MKFQDLWRWEGKVGRAEYAAVGLIGVAIKHNHLIRKIHLRVLEHIRGVVEEKPPASQPGRD
jgi:hypothetical protein